MVFKGFRFGMLLQFAVGPVCIFIFQVAAVRGFYAAEAGVLGVVLIDGLYILAATLGIGSIIEKKNVKLGLRLFGAVILFVFGLSMALNQINISLMPTLNIQSFDGSNSAFFNSVILTASNPLTIIFWAGVFSVEIAKNNMRRKDIYFFGMGALMATIFFLTLIALAGNFTKAFLPSLAIQIINTAVGVLLIYFSIRMIIRKQ